MLQSSGAHLGGWLFRYRGRSSAESIEYRKTMFYCFKNIEFDKEMQERILEADDLQIKP